MIRFTIGLKKREKRIREYEELRCALENLMRVILESLEEISGSVIRKMSKAGRRGARAGKKLKKIFKKEAAR